jgi:hypothetical protein
MRQAFGARYGREQLPVPAWSNEFQVEDFSNVIANVLGIGADFRALYFSRRSPGVAAVDGFYDMQGDMYLNFRIARHVAFFLKKGLRDGFEAFGLFNLLPLGGHVKVGKFVPNYGLRTDDHTTYVRQQTAMSPESGRPERTGLEAGISPGPISIVGGLYNGDESAFVPSTSAKTFLGRAEGIFVLGEGLNLCVGGNVFTGNVGGISSTFYGGFGSFSAGNLTLLAEADWIRTKSPVGVTRTGLATCVEGDLLVTQGLDIKAMYEFFDNDIDFQTGARSRYSFGLEFFPLTGVELRPLYRFVKEDPPVGDNNEIDLLLHLYL